jgi:hypothetical protein
MLQVFRSWIRKNSDEIRAFLAAQVLRSDYTVCDIQQQWHICFQILRSAEFLRIQLHFLCNCKVKFLRENVVMLGNTESSRRGAWG